MDDFRNRNVATWKIYHGIKVQEFIGLLGLHCVTNQTKRNRRLIDQVCSKSEAPCDRLDLGRGSLRSQIVFSTFPLDSKGKILKTCDTSSIFYVGT